MARPTQMDESRAKIGIEMDHPKARLIELLTEAKVAKLDERAMAGEEAGKVLKKGIKRSTKELKKSVKDADRKLTLGGAGNRRAATPLIIRSLIKG